MSFTIIQSRNLRGNNFKFEQILLIFNLIINRVLTFSIHRYDYGKFNSASMYSDFEHIGEQAAKGFNINVPLNEVNMI